MRVVTQVRAAIGSPHVVGANFCARRSPGTRR
jgi:hypothetical protein